MEYKTKNWVKKAALALGTALAALALMFVPVLAARAENKKPAAAASSTALTQTPVFSVKIAAAGKRTLRTFLDVNGDIVSSRQAEAFPDVPGKLSAVYAALGSYVRQGDVIAEVDPSKPGAVYLASPVYAPISGVVSRTPLSVGSAVATSTAVTAISVTSDLEISARVPEREVAGLKTGLRAEVTLQAYPGEVFSAVVTRVAPVLDSASRTKLITLKFNGADSRINAGMFARIRINTRTYEDTLAVPGEAVVARRGEKAVYVLAEGEPARTEARIVTTGVTLDGLIEIKSGLNEGEAVVVQGQQFLTDGAPVRVIGEI